ncbi:Alpha/Beta hydrolase protein [Aspergillus karnatakaensis]|uniref:alpha/beta hydrolase n=1 Tax=Aspergillus karnatakaensis TaxID=1810916 RepID=UPI003CCE25F4
MPTRPPTKSDFPSSLTITLTPPPQSSSPATSRPPPNILLLLHGLGDTHAPFTSLAQNLNLAETTILTIQAPQPLPFDLPGFHWGDDINFDSRTGALDMDAGFEKASKLLVEDIVRDILVKKCGYALREILLWGFGQGGVLGVVCAERVHGLGLDIVGDGSGKGELGGIISIGGAYPLSLVGKRTGGSAKGKSRTPILLIAGRDSDVVTEGAVKRTKDVFEFVETHHYSRRGDTMPRSREEMMPIMRFLGRRLRSWQGVPEGSVEIS